MRRRIFKADPLRHARRGGLPRDAIVRLVPTILLPPTLPGQAGHD